MTDIQALLKAISNDFFLDNNTAHIKNLITRGVITEEAFKTQWLGYPGATAEQIKERENYLGITLPPSYKLFLLCSNGFGPTSSLLDNLSPVEKIDWAKNVEAEWWFDLEEQHEIETPDEKYFVYGEEQESVWYRGEYFRKSIKVSEWYDGMCVFLNPVVKFGEEWEVLVYATWDDGTPRYKSFLDFLIATHNSNERFQDSKNSG